MGPGVVRASLADQGGAAVSAPLAIALGANLPSAAGTPLQTLIAVRPQLAQLIAGWSGAGCGLLWSPLFSSAPVGGPPGQPDYINAVLVADVPLRPAAEQALTLLSGLQALEAAFGRQRLERWGPRSLDLDLLWWGGFSLNAERLQLPHPRWHQRSFVLEPLRAIATALTAGSGQPAAWPALPDRRAGMDPRLVALPGRPGWPE